MRGLIVYESMFGNTRDIALAIAEGLRSAMDVEVVEVGDAPTRVDDVDLLILGGPTHAFGMTRPGTRRDAMTPKYAADFEGEFISTDMGIREWLATATVPPGTRFATFDTRVAHPRLPGSAASKAAKALRKRGLSPVADPESFWVEGGTGPLSDGEATRASAWGRGIASTVTRGT